MDGRYEECEWEAAVAGILLLEFLFESLHPAVKMTHSNQVIQATKNVGDISFVAQTIVYGNVYNTMVLFGHISAYSS
jgi:hypothetical protein